MPSKVYRALSRTPAALHQKCGRCQNTLALDNFDQMRDGRYRKCCRRCNDISRFYAVKNREAKAKKSDTSPNIADIADTGNIGNTGNPISPISPISNKGKKYRKPVEVEQMIARFKAEQQQKVLDAMAKQPNSN